MSDSDRVPHDGEGENDDHLSDVQDGCGCAEIWDHLSEKRVSD
jgi:hypothetical protein